MVSVPLAWVGSRERRLRLPAVLAVVGLACLRLVMVAPAAHAAGGSYTVTSTGDQPDVNPGDGLCVSTAGLCTLRAALTEANMDNGPSTVSFLIPGTGTQTITLTSSLPTLTDQAGGTTIDGYTQPGSSVNTDPVVDNAVLKVEIKGAGSSAFDALDIASPNNLIRGLAFYNHRLAMDMEFHGDSNVIVGDFIGTNAAATFFDSATNTNSFGVVIDQLAKNNFIGRPNAADRNVISGNSGRAVMLKDAVQNNTIQNNIVGLAPNGLSKLPNADHGIDVNAGATNTLIGGTGPMQGNLVSGNDGHGVEISHPPCCGQPGTTANNKIIGNRIGTDPSGNSGPSYAQNGIRYGHENVHTEDHVVNTEIAYNIIGNTSVGGIKVDNFSSGTYIHDNKIGISANGTAISNGPYGIQIEEGSHGTIVGPNNVIANNQNGIRLQDGVTQICMTTGCPTMDNTITQNSIYGNSALGIDIAPFGIGNSTDPSTTQNGIQFPVLASATATTVTGQTCANCRADLYVADGTTTDPSLQTSYGEGKTFVAAANADGSGNFAIAFPASASNRFMTATATDSAGNTSEFSRNLVVPASTDLIDDSFTRTGSAGWGNADVGGPWTPQASPSSFAVNGTQGTITDPAGGDLQIDALGVATSDVDLAATLNTDRLPVGGDHIISLVARRQSATLMYRARLRISSTGAVFVGVDNGAQLLGTETQVAGLNRSAGPIRLRAQISGTNPTVIKLKAWTASTSEPAAWNETLTDNSPGLQQAGTTGVHATSTETTGTPVVVSIDDYTARTPSPK